MDSPATNRISVSVIVPTYGEAENLPPLVAQVAEAFNACGWRWELIVVDDNSPDATSAVLAALAQDHPQLRFLIRKEDRGLS
ncbi:MAG: glycosyltransferase, partial [Phycisphaerae bacterium]|nr:glycosyltransferase [Phycisphaerae bacterium]